MRTLALTLILLLAQGCSSGIVVHDQYRAAELIVDFLSSLKSAEGIQLAYAWTDDRYKQETSASEFVRIVARIRNLNQGAEIQLTGYETFGPVELLNIYASSGTGESRLYFRSVRIQIERLLPVEARCLRLAVRQGRIVWGVSGIHYR
jgi:hypothetical protein